jgi:hypothetical protein
LKKRSKKLLIIQAEPTHRRTPMCKSFLVLFFKKEHSYFLSPENHPCRPTY